MRSASILPILGLIVAVSLTACEREPAWKKNVELQIEEVAGAEGDVRLPASMWERVQGLQEAPSGSVEESPSQKQATETGAKKILETEFAPLHVYFVEKTPGVLQRGHIEMIFSPGGGEIDLADLVSGRNGSFRFVADFLPGEEKIERRVFYLSGAIARQKQGPKGGEQLGAGCNRYFDVSKAFQDALNGEGFLVNTTDGRHVSALAGTYIFSASVGKVLKVARLTIRDSNARSLQCQR